MAASIKRKCLMLANSKSSSNSYQHLPRVSRLLSNTAMRTASEIRRLNLIRLLSESQFSTLAALAEASSSAPAYLSQVKNAIPDSRGKPKVMGNKLARKLEEACGKPTGWMDRDHDHDEKRPSTPFFESSSPPGTCNTAPFEKHRVEAVVIEWEEVSDFERIVRTPGTREHLSKAYSTHDRGFVLKMREDSMLPTLPVGSLVLIDPDIRPEHNQIVLVGESAAQPLLRRLIVQGSQHWLKADNDRYGPLTPMKAPQHIIGVAVDALVRLL